MFVGYQADYQLLGGREGKDIKVLRLLCNVGEYLEIDSGLFAKYVTRALEEGHDCSLGKIVRERGIVMIEFLIIELQNENGRVKQLET